jgi:hypothetical protein
LVLPPFITSQTIPTGSVAIRLVDAVPDYSQTFTLSSTTAPAGMPGTLSTVGYDFATYEADYSFAVVPSGVLAGMSLSSSAAGSDSFATNTIANYQFQTGRAYTILVYGSPTTTTTLNALVLQDYPIQG